MNTHLSIILANAEAEITNTINTIYQTYNIPAYLMEGIMLNALDTIRSKKHMEIYNELCSERDELIKQNNELNNAIQQIEKNGNDTNSKEE